MKKKNFIPFIAISVLCAACHDKTTLTGDWIEPVPGTTNTIQGFSLKENGEATSINMATLQYKSWTQEDNRLILSGESIGNHQTISFSDTLKIFKLSEDSLILKKGDLVKTYTRPKSIIPATPIQPATSITFTVKGKLVIGHEVRSFIAEGDTTSYWIIDDSRTLKEEYEKKDPVAVAEKTIGNNPEPYTPVYAELKVIDTGKSNEGFAAEYAGVYHVKEVLNISPIKPE